MGPIMTLSSQLCAVDMPLDKFSVQMMNSIAATSVSAGCQRPEDTGFVSKGRLRFAGF